MAQVLAEWAGTGLVAVIDVLPSRTWDRTDLDAERARLHGNVLGTGRVRSWPYRGGLLDVDPAGTKGQRTPSRSWNLTRSESAVGRASRHFAPEYGFDSPSPDEHLEDLFALATPTSRKLAGLLVVGSFSRRGLRTAAGIAGANRRDLSEIFAFGLLAHDSLSTTFSTLRTSRSGEQKRRRAHSPGDRFQHGQRGAKSLGVLTATPTDQTSHPPARSARRTRPLGAGRHHAHGPETRRTTVDQHGRSGRGAQPTTET